MSADLELDPVLDINQAAPLREALLALRGQDLRIDAGRVERLGGLCLQALLAARRTWSADGHRLRVEPCSDAFDAALDAFAARDALLETDPDPEADGAS